MKTMKEIYVSLLALSVSSCLSLIDGPGNDSITITVENQTGGTLNHVNVYVIQDVSGGIARVRTDSSRIGVLNNLKVGAGRLHEKNIENVDGAFLLTATDASGRRYEETFGYLTNGGFIEESQYLIVKQDTILFKR